MLEAIMTKADQVFFFFLSVPVTVTGSAFAKFISFMKKKLNTCHIYDNWKESVLETDNTIYVDSSLFS